MKRQCVNFTHHGLSYGKNINDGGSIAEHSAFSDGEFRIYLRIFENLFSSSLWNLENKRERKAHFDGVIGPL
jgi:hypothetical protein